MSDLVVIPLESLCEELRAVVREVLAEQREQPASAWMTAKEAAEYVRRPVGSIYKLTATGQIPFHRNGGTLRFNRVELDEWVAGSVR